MQTSMLRVPAWEALPAATAHRSCGAMFSPAPSSRSPSTRTTFQSPTLPTHSTHSSPLTLTRASPPPRLLQIKGTVLLMPNGTDRITNAPLQKLETDKAVADEDVKALLAVGSWLRFFLWEGCCCCCWVMGGARCCFVCVFHSLSLCCSIVR